MFSISLLFRFSCGITIFLLVHNYSLVSQKFLNCWNAGKAVIFSIMQTGTEYEKAGTVKILTRRVANWYEWWRNKTERKQNKNRVLIVKLMLEGIFSEHKTSELLEVKPREILASWVLSKLPMWIHYTIYTH